MIDDYYEYSAPELVRMLGLRFKEYRLRANLTQKEVAEMAGVSILTIHRPFPFPAIVPEAVRMI